LTCPICDQIFTKPLHWPKPTDLPQGATHAVDFGAGGVSGIGPLTACNLDGCGVRVIAIREKGKGDAEFYSVRGVKTEQSCRQCCQPTAAASRRVASVQVPRALAECFRHRDRVRPPMATNLSVVRMAARVPSHWLRSWSFSSLRLSATVPSCGVDSILSDALVHLASRTLGHVPLSG
jgi:hypothetical protein